MTSFLTHSSTSSKALPKAITSYDLLKAAAIILMIIDHIGWYFFPDDAWWRTIGRLCVPIWFFLIGYASSRDIPKLLWIGGVILIIGNIVSGMAIIPLNILFSMMIVRLLLDSVMRNALKDMQGFLMAVFALTVLTIPTSALFEYGTQGMLIAMFGYMVRHQKEARALNKDIVEVFLVANLLIFVGLQALFFGLDQQQTFMLAIGSFFVYGLLWLFRPKSYAEFTKKIPSAVTVIIQVMGRRTLEIYVVHLLLFKGMAMLINPEKYALFQWSFFVLP